jgi:hypothetical protein
MLQSGFILGSDSLSHLLISTPEVSSAPLSPGTIADQIHRRALEVIIRYKKSEGELIEIIQLAEKNRVPLHRGHSSLFQYVVRDLGLAENLAYSLITVARKAVHIPEIKAQIQSGVLSLSHAKKIVPIINVQNQDEWLAKARSLSIQKLEKEVVHMRPRLATPERASYVRGDHVKLEVGLSEQSMLRLRRAQDLLSQSQQRAMTLEETIEALTNEFLIRSDPLEKAKRHVVRNESLPVNSGFALKRIQPAVEPESKPKPTESLKKLISKRVKESRTNDVQIKEPQIKQRQIKQYQRESIPAQILHRVNLRDQRRCTFVPSIQHDRDSPNTIKRCSSTRWLHIHHIQPVHEGGGNTLENLTTLCEAHHRWVHIEHSR